MQFKFCQSLIWLLVAASATFAQTTAFTYQGKLTDGGNPANGNYDLQFKLFNTATVGTGVQAAPPLVRNPVTATAGIFTVTLDFGAAVFGGPDRYLEIGVRPADNGNAYTVLAPRQPITSVPYAIQTLNAQQLGGLPANRYLNTDASGNVGIATPPTAGFRLDVNGPTLLRPGGSGGGFISFHTPNSETGMTFNGNGTTRADLRFNGSTLKLVASQSGIPADTSGVVITTNGRVGIGTNDPLVKLDVKTSTGGAISGVSDAANSAGVTGIGSIGLQGYSSRAKGDIAVAAFGSSWFSGDSTPLDATNIGPGTGIVIGSNTDSFGYISAFDYALFQTRTLALNLSGGRVGIGTSVPDQTLSVSGNASKSVGGGSWLFFSDERLKNIERRFTRGLSAVMRLQPVVYQYKPENALGLRSEGDHIGFSAQAVEKIVPEAVTKNEQGYRLVNNDPIMWTMLNAIKEQQALIEAQKKQIAEQRAVNNGQQIELNALKALVCRHRRQSTVCK